MSADTETTGTEEISAEEKPSGLEALGALQDSQEPEKTIEPKLDAYGRAYATGKRKLSIARVWIKRGSGIIKVNGKNSNEYFGRAVLQMIVESPFKLSERENQFDVSSSVCGGGLSGQAGALRHGISKALSLYDTGFRSALKKVGFLTRDARVVERKKYGLAKARRSYQFSKR